jgi:hypothetical protein
VAEDDGLSFTPVVVVDLRTVFGGDRAHGVFSFAPAGGAESCRPGTSGTPYRRESGDGCPGGGAEQEVVYRRYRRLFS